MADGAQSWRTVEIRPTVARPRGGAAKMGLRGRHQHPHNTEHKPIKLKRGKLLKRRALLWKWKTLKSRKKSLCETNEEPNKKLKLRMAVINVKGINEPAKRRVIEEWASRKKVDLVILTETQHAHCSQEGGCDRLEDEVMIESKWKWYFSTSVDPKAHEESEKKRKSGKHVTMEDRNRTREHAGVACLLNKSLWSKVKDVQPIDGRIMKCKLRMSRKVNITIAYAPHAGRPEEEKATFYNKLYESTARDKTNEINVVAGDFNARLVKPQTEEEKRYIGSCGLGKDIKDVAEFSEGVSSNRDRLLEFCRVRDMRAMNTYFQKKDCNLATYRPLGISPSAEISATTHEQIDYVLINTKEARSIRNVTSDTKALLMTDHYPLITELRLLFNFKQQTTQKKCNRYCEKEMELDPKEMNEFLRKRKEDGRISTYNEWLNIYREYVEKQTKRPNKPWRDYITAETKSLINDKNELEANGNVEDARALNKNNKTSPEEGQTGMDGETGGARDSMQRTVGGNQNLA